MPKPTLTAMDEFDENKIMFRDPETEEGGIEI
jgi:DNA-directed RNA polymerase subunit K/omega